MESNAASRAQPTRDARSGFSRPHAWLRRARKPPARPRSPTPATRVHSTPPAVKRHTASKAEPIVERVSPTARSNPHPSPKPATVMPSPAGQLTSFVVRKRESYSSFLHSSPNAMRPPNLKTLNLRLTFSVNLNLRIIQRRSERQWFKSVETPSYRQQSSGAACRGFVEVPVKFQRSANDDG